MSASSNCCSSRFGSLLAWAMGVGGSLLIIGALAWLVVQPTAPIVDVQRASERRKFRAEVEAPVLELKSYGLVPNMPNAGGVYRLPVDRALEIAAQEWTNPAEGREKLLKRFEAANTKPSFE